MSDQVRNEVAHGRRLSLADTERTWGWGTPAGQQRAHRRAQLIIQGAGLHAGMRALEVGCGTGNFTARFVVAGAHITAIDVSPDLLERAAERNLPPERVRFQCLALEQYPGEGMFDAAIGSSVLHHLDIRRALRRIFALLKPGGSLSFAEPNALNPQIFASLTFLRPWVWSISPGETAFVRWTLRKLLVEAGFTKIQIEPFDWLHPSTPPGLIGAVAQLGQTLEAIPLARQFAGSLRIIARRPA